MSRAAAAHTLPHRTLYKDYPPALREAYATAIRAKEWSKRHAQLLHLGETTIAYLASLAFSDYRSARYFSPDAGVERVLANATRGLSAGSHAELFELSSKAITDPIFDVAVAMKYKLDAGAAFQAAMAGIQEAVDTEAGNLKRCLEGHLKRTPKALVWTKFWGVFAQYRNRSAGHPTSYHWPIAHDDYYELMTPYLEAALVEALTAGFVVTALFEHPVGRLEQVQAMGEEYAHEFSGDDAGVPFLEALTEPQRLTERWPTQDWRAEVGREFVLRRCADGSLRVRALFHDLMQNELPKPLLTEPELGTAAAIHAPRNAPIWSTGKGSAPGTCGELAQGLLSDGTNFHVTCPITKSAAVQLRLRPAAAFEIHGLKNEQRKLELSLRHTAETLDLGELEIHVDSWSDLDVGKGMGSSTADILAAARALADAVGETLDSETLGAIAASIESSDGTMYEGIAAVNHKNGTALRRWAWWPEFVIVMLVPPNRLNTESVTFAGKPALADQYGAILAGLDAAVAQRDTAAFAAQATTSAQLNQRFVINPYFSQLRRRLDEFGALGANVGHTGTVLGLLYENTPDGHEAASGASIGVQQMFPNVQVEITATPERCS